MDGTPQLTLATADEPALIDAARRLFREYADTIGVDLQFQDFEAELASLPGEYVAPGGALLVALVDGQPGGCGALRPLLDVDYANACEMKRLYVPRAFRRFGLGRLIAQQLIELARQAGYSTMLLDTLDDMEAARGLYASLGFEDIPPYYYNPLPGAHYLKVDLDATGTRW
ncbi:MAG TPA: GNAT family N-acetyltransferase [Rubrivivax sp.]|nr:GNAT family N-acetyltransferase [Rubrivivax sp.]